MLFSNLITKVLTQSVLNFIKYLYCTKTAALYSFYFFTDLKSINFKFESFLNKYELKELSILTQKWFLRNKRKIFFFIQLTMIMIKTP